MNSINCDVVTTVHNSHEKLQDNCEKHTNESKKKRRVRFPSDTLVSDYLEPFHPAPDNCTSEELIAAYVGACLRYKIQPIGFLLEQLKGIDLSICNERYSRLSLKGIRLSRPHMETLEEIFRRVHFRELDFDETYLDDQSATALFDMLLHYETCNELKVSLTLDNGATGQAWNHCITFLRRSEQLRRFCLTHTHLSLNNFLGISFFGLSTECLSLRDCNITGQTLYALVRWLRLLLASTGLEPPNRIKNSTLINGHRRGGSLTHRCPRRVKCMDRFAPNNSSFYQPPVWELTLDLSSNKMVPSDAETLLPLVRHQILVPRIPWSGFDQLGPSTIAMSSDGDTGEGETTHPDLLPVGGIGFLMQLDLSNNNLGDDGLRTLCNGLIQCNRGRLKQIHSENESTTGVEATESTCRASSHRMTHCTRGLERLSIARNNLTALSMQALAFVLMQSPSNLVHILGGLCSLDLSYNPEIRDQGIEILCIGLIQNHSLKELYLRSVGMSFSGIFALSSFLSESKCLDLLDIRGNELNLASLMALSKTLTLNHNLTSLLSDARALANSNCFTDASDVELIIWLIDEIDTCLQRNRTHVEEKTKTEHNQKQAEEPDTSSPHSLNPSIDCHAVSETLNSDSLLDASGDSACSAFETTLTPVTPSTEECDTHSAVCCEPLDKEEELEEEDVSAFKTINVRSSVEVTDEWLDRFANQCLNGSDQLAAPSEVQIDMLQCDAVSTSHADQTFLPVCCNGDSPADTLCDEEDCQPTRSGSVSTGDSSELIDTLVVDKPDPNEPESLPYSAPEPDLTERTSNRTSKRSRKKRTKR